MADARIFQFPGSSETPHAEVNGQVKRFNLSDEDLSRLEILYRQRGLDQAMSMGREALLISGIEAPFVEALLDVAEGFSMIHQPGLEIVANTKDTTLDQNYVFGEGTPLFIGFLGWYDREEVTVRGREVLAGTDKILEGLGLSFHLT